MKYLIISVTLFITCNSWAQFSEYSPLASTFSIEHPKVYQQVKKFCLKKWMGSAYTPRRIDDAQAILTIYDIHAQLKALNELKDNEHLDGSKLIQVLQQTVADEDKALFQNLVDSKNENLLLENCMFDWIKTKELYLKLIF